MKAKLLGAFLVSSLAAGCASVPMERSEMSELAKQFNPPSEQTSGIYVYRKDSVVGAALKKDLWIDDECLGESAKGVFFYREVEGGEHTVSTESEFSPNSLVLQTEPGELYFVEQYIKMGAFVGGADVQQVEASEGKKDVSKLKLAKSGNCSSAE